MNPATLLELLVSPEFLAGVGWGLVGAIVIALASRPNRLRPVWGPVVTACAVFGSLPFVERQLWVLVGVAVVGIGGELTRRSLGLGLLLVAAGGGAMAVGSDIPDVTWVWAGTVTFVVVGGYAIARTSEVLGSIGFSVVLVAGTAFGIWATVPDTELPAILLGVLTSTVFLIWPQPRTRIGPGGAYALAATLAWMIAVGGAARHGSIVGGWGTIGALAGAMFLTARFAHTRWLLLILHGVAVIVAGRIGGLMETGSEAAIVVVPTLLVAAASVYFLKRWTETLDPIPD